MSEWNGDMSAAPRDGAKVDLWVVETHMGKATGERVTDCWWGKPSDSYSFSHGTTNFPDQWCVDGDRYGDPIDDRVEGEGRTVTHWMPIPKPPA